MIEVTFPCAFVWMSPPSTSAFPYVMSCGLRGLVISAGYPSIASAEFDIWRFVAKYTVVVMKTPLCLCFASGWRKVGLLCLDRLGARRDKPPGKVGRGRGAGAAGCEVLEWSGGAQLQKVRHCDQKDDRTNK